MDEMLTLNQANVSKVKAVLFIKLVKSSETKNTCSQTGI
jgi:hypothetical protein